jgi:hypothetical protein
MSYLPHTIQMCSGAVDITTEKESKIITAL